MIVTPAEMPAWCLSTVKIEKNVLICLTGRNLYLMYGNDIMKRKIGVVTTSYEEGKITAYIEFLRKKIEDAPKFKGTLVGYKTDIEMIRLKKELSFFKNFYDKKFVYLDPEGKEEIWNIDVIIDDHHTFKWEL